MDEYSLLAHRREVSTPDVNNSFSQYLSFRFYKDNLDQLTDKTKDSINNFLKTISEIEDDFVNTISVQKLKNFELLDLGLEADSGVYLEENY